MKKAKVYEIEYLLDSVRQTSIEIAENAAMAVYRVESKFKGNFVLVSVKEKGTQG